MEHRFHLSRLSENIKLGGLPASTSSKSTCPPNCALKLNGCYADYGPLQHHWKALSEGRRGVSLDEHCNQIRSLPQGQLWRLFQAGDFPGNDGVMDVDAVDQLVQANKGRRGFGFTHYSPYGVNADVIRSANRRGLVINLSAETLDQVDEYLDTGVGPVVTLLPADQTKAMKTPKGRTVIVCPASLGKTTCAICGLCAKPTRKSVVGFPAHGTTKAKAQKVFFMAPASL